MISAVATICIPPSTMNTPAWIATARAMIKTDDSSQTPNASRLMALNGTVPSYPQYLEAAAAAQRVAGVTDVHNHLEVVLPDSDYRDDAMLTTAANNALTLNVTVPA